MLQHALAQTLPRFLTRFRPCNSIETLKKLHALLIAAGLIRRHSAVIQVAGNYLGLGSSALALSVLDAVERPTILAFQNLAIRCLLDRGLHGELLCLYSRLQRSRRRCSDNFTFPVVIKACGALSTARAGREVHCAVLRTGYGGNVVVQTALLDMYSEFGRIDLSEKVFDGMPERDLVSWNAMMSAYCSSGLEREALRALSQMRADGFTPNSSTFATMLPLCKSLGMPPVGKSMHGLAVKCGAFGEESLVPTLISMYAGFEDLDAARMLFESLNSKDAVAWNAMISAYVRNEKWDMAMETFQLMQRMGEQPNFLTLIPVLASCSNLFGICHGESVHAFGVKLGVADQDSVVAALVSMYAKLGDTDSARYLFQFVEEKSLLLWNCMVSGYNMNGFWSLGLDTFREMQLGSVGPDDISLVSAIAACTLAEDLLGGKSVHAYSIRNGFDTHTKVANALLSFYCECDQILNSLKLFNAMQVRDAISWNAIIKGFAKAGDAPASVASFCVMRQEGVLFDIVTMISVLSSFCEMGERAFGMFFHAISIKTRCDLDVALTNALISMYAALGDIEAANLLFNGLSYKTIVTWNSLMTGYRKKNLFKEIFLMFDQMKMEGQKPNSVTLLNILPACESQLQGKSVHAYALRNLASLEPTLATAAMMMYGRFNNRSYCCMLFEMVDKSRVVAWNTMMSIHIQTKHEREAVTSFSRMLQMDQEPDHVTMLCLSSASSQLGSIDLARCVTGFVIRKGFRNYTSVGNSIIDMFARCGSLSTAEKLFYEMEEKDSITWGIMINGYGVHGDGKTALSLFAQMNEAGVKADDTVFLSALSACSHAGLIEEGCRMFKLMIENYGIVPRMEHYACMVDLFGRAGKLEEAYDVLKSMPSEPSAGLLESMLGACKSYHSNVIGEAVGNLLVELSPLDPCSYVMLSNIYAGAERWTEYGRARCSMELTGVKKDAGISVIEVTCRAQLEIRKETSAKQLLSNAIRENFIEWKHILIRAINIRFRIDTMNQHASTRDSKMLAPTGLKRSREE